MKTLAVVAGGFTGEREISLKSAQMVLDHFDHPSFRPQLVVIDQSGWRAVVGDTEFPIHREDFSYTDADGTRHHFAGAFVMVHGTPGEDGKLQGYFDLIGIPYSTGPQATMALTFHKAFCNGYLESHGFKVAKRLLLRAQDHYSTADIVGELGLPIFVKPNSGGSSLATSKVDVKEGLHRAIDAAMGLDGEVIIEQFLPGTEVTCGVIEVDGVATALPATEIISRGAFFDFEAKYHGQSEEITPARIKPAAMEAVQNTAVQLWKLLDCRGMIRVDFMLHEGIPAIIEINTVPGFSEASIIPQQAAAIGLSKAELIRAVLAGMAPYFTRP